MKKNLLFYFVLGFHIIVKAQNPFSVSWPLTDPSTGGTAFKPNISGAVTASDETFRGTELNGYTGANNSQRVRMKTIPSNTWPAGLTSKIDSVYVEFVVSPKTGIQLSVTGISLNIGATAINTMRAAIFYSTDPDFKNSVEVSFTTGNTNNYLTRDKLGEVTATLSVDIPDGKKFYLRVYPWVESSSVSSGKYMIIQNVVVSGSSTGNIIAQLPSIATTNAGFVSTTSASSGGSISSDGGGAIIARGVCWNTAGNPSVNDKKTSDGTGVGIFTSSITGLEINTKYFVKAYATNSAGTAYGSEISFTTMAALTLPTVSTNEVSSIMITTVVCGGNVSDWGGTPVTARGVCWNSTGNPTINDNKTVEANGAGSFSSYITGLTKSTKYFVRAYATNNNGTNYGMVKEFTTQEPAPDVLKIVAQDGSGDYKTVQAAFRAVPSNYTGRWTIFVKRGKYYELDTLAAGKVNVLLIGEDRDNTILVYDNYATSGLRNPSSTINANDFTAMNITFQNTSHDIAQALALETNGDRISFYNCSIKGYQDTFLGNGNARVYFKDCFVEGTVDFIYGRSIMIFDKCTIKELREGGYITAASTESTSKFGINFLDCTITNDPIGYNGNAINSFYLGRPWQGQPRVVYLRCYEPATVNPLGWTTMAVTPALYAEYNCSGPGYKPLERTKLWSTVKQLTDAEAADYTIKNIFSKNSSTSFSSDWVPEKPNVNVPTAIQIDNKNIPAEFKLFQNYPNPFNPETIISYRLSAFGYVTLKVYDILGREVATLVDEYKQPGTYNSIFNASHVSTSPVSGQAGSSVTSGVYFYKLTAGSFSETKKFILMK